MFSKLIFLGALLLCNPAGAFDYNITSAGELALSDNSTGISDLGTLFTGDVTLVSVVGVQWEPSGVEGGDEAVSFQTLLNGEVVDSGEISLVGVERQLPDSFDCGSVVTDRCKSLSKG